MNLGIKLKTWLCGVEKGRDAFGNRYFENKKNPMQRWVLYKGLEEASKVPGEWHGWLHHTVADVPSDTDKQHAWQQEHTPNLTGTIHAYRPPGHLLKGGERAASGSDYEAWKP
jgi:NADH:ubiquinone oxidoreductase subunit